MKRRARDHFLKFGQHVIQVRRVALRRVVIGIMQVDRPRCGTYFMNKAVEVISRQARVFPSAWHEEKRVNRIVDDRAVML